MENKSRAEYQRKYRERNPEKMRKYYKDWTRNNPEKVKAKSDKKRERLKALGKRNRTTSLIKLGVSHQQYDLILKSQKSSCAICKAKTSSLKRRLAIDHCHKTGKIRGLLCNNCNTGIGYLQESREIMLRAIEYITNNNFELPIPAVLSKAAGTGRS